jgi:hypothetical protein
MMQRHQQRIFKVVGLACLGSHFGPTWNWMLGHELVACGEGGLGLYQPMQYRSPLNETCLSK